MRFSTSSVSFLLAMTLIAAMPSVVFANGRDGCDLTVSEAWIRAAPPMAAVHAGYATLVNDGTKPLRIVAASSSAFASVEMHETTEENGISKMRALRSLTIVPHTTVKFEPGGKHFMLKDATRPLSAGDRVVVSLTDAAGCTATASFVVRAQ